MADIQGGFDCTFVDKPPRSVQCECPVCLLVLREPYQAICCGYNFCRVCIEQFKAKKSPCPCCRSDQLVHFPHKRLQQTLYAFQVTCTNKNQGCKWVEELRHLDNHLNICETEERRLEGCLYTKIKCVHCSKYFQRLNVQDHETVQCTKRPFSCQYCTFESNYEDVTTNHWPQCAYYPVQCPNKCGETIERHDLEKHFTSDCIIADSTIDSSHFTGKLILLGL